MAQYIKERNFIVVKDGEAVKAKVDILTGVYYGVKGTPLKAKPSYFTSNRLYAENVPSYLHTALNMIAEYHSSWQWTQCSYGKTLEKLVSLGLSARYRSDLAFDYELDKDCVKYFMDNCDGVVTRDRYSEYLEYKRNKSFFNTLPEEVKPYALRIMSSRSDIDTHYLKTMLNRIVSEKVLDVYENYNSAVRVTIDSLITHYYDMCKAMYGTVKVNPNIVSSYIELAFIYKKWKNENTAKLLATNNDKPYFDFEDDNFIVVKLLSAEDFHAEATAQSNCVERIYMGSVVEGGTTVCAIRRKSDPTHSFITCEVSLDGTIRQYLYRQNRWVSDCSPEGMFKEKFQKHIYEVMGR